MRVQESIHRLAGLDPAQCRARSIADQEATPKTSATRKTTHDRPEDVNARATERQASMADALQSQIAEIIKHRERLARRMGRDVGLDEAASDWIRRHAAAWRAKYESGTHSR